MKRHASQLSFILAAFAFAPAALAGSEIVKCVDSAGHVTLTDQPCTGDATTVRLMQVAPSTLADELVPGEPEAGTEENADLAVSVQERHAVTPVLRQTSWKTPPAPRSKPLAQDVATLKAARLQLQMMDSEAKRQPHLAGLR